MIKNSLNKIRGRRRPAGFSLVEVLLGMFIIAVAVIGLAQLFLLSVANNSRSSEITNAVFLAQQQVDLLRTLTRDELLSYPDTSLGFTDDEVLDLNADGTPDFRRLTTVLILDPEFEVRVLVFPASKVITDREDLLGDPEGHKARADVNTIIAR